MTVSRLTEKETDLIDMLRQLRRLPLRNCSRFSRNVLHAYIYDLGWFVLPQTEHVKKPTTLINAGQEPKDKMTFVQKTGICDISDHLQKQFLIHRRLRVVAVSVAAIPFTWAIVPPEDKTGICDIGDPLCRPF